MSPRKHDGGSAGPMKAECRACGWLSGHAGVSMSPEGAKRPYREAKSSATER
jgi:hypothetical protein